MICQFCQENVRGTPCQSSTQAATCVNNRDDDWPEDRMQSESQCQTPCKTEKEPATQE